MSVSHYLEHVRRDFKLWKMNMDKSRNIRKFLQKEDDNFLYRAGSAADLKAIEHLHFSLFRGPMVNWLHWVYKFRAPELMSVIVDKKTNKVIGYDLYMFNESELKDRYIHEQYLGIDPNYQGKSLSVSLRKFSIECYNFGVLYGVSTLANLDDIKAIRSAQKAGFAIKKLSVKPRAHYMVYPLTVYR